ncbi:PREDICTED: nuclear transcription factor Y subunit beta [Drosophila arizonae]|uniref:Nuclear transcription factor Y subunit beta n=1 Tax=Drosophila arizonae TaxID=7263 RepID=A0ABM1PQJ6_DROAR|nr:PREDICTED: nuclear transcription factor Y subunit beta [Drosophila arizonae]
MRGFIVLCLSAVALAVPQGYNYNPGPSAVAGLSSISGSGASFFQAAQQQQQQQVHFQQPHQQTFFQQQSGVNQQYHAEQHQQQQQQPIVSKRFFIHSAPEDIEEEYKERHITVGVPKRNYNVVFIKSPQRSNKKTSIKISPAVNEDKTVIYVLSKKTDSSDIHAEVVEQPSSTSKPEVFFIKYKTNEEAAHAQQQIQAQYDSLGGTSQLTDEGVAPVTSVIGALGGQTGGDAGATAVGSTGIGASAGQAISHQAVTSGHGHTSNAYLPPSF